MKTTKLNIAFLIPLVVIFSFGMDSYIPFLLDIKSDLNLSTPIVQLSLSIYMFSLAIGQVFIGLLSDYIGRKKALYLSAVILIIASIICGLATNGYMLIFGRFIQGLGACGLRSVSYTIVKDYYDGDTASSNLTRLYSAVSLSPMVAPLIGGLVGNIWGWEAIFFMMAVMGILMISCIYPLPETFTKQDQKPLKQHFLDIFAVFKDKHIILFGCLSACGISTMFCFISIMSYVIKKQYTLSEGFIYLAFIWCGIGMLTAGFLSKRLIIRIGSYNTLYLTFSLNVFLLAFTIIMSSVNLFNVYLYFIISTLLLSISVIVNGCSISIGISNRKTLIGLGISIIGVLGYGITSINGWLLSFFPMNTLSYGVLLGLFYSIMGIFLFVTYYKKSNAKTK